MKRQAVSQKTRFEVFKRDKFTCQYCGAKAPDVLLHADHVVPVAEGGPSDILNLVTACSVCNGGKGKRPLHQSDELDKQRTQLEQLQERRAQLEMMLAWRSELSLLSEDVVSSVADRLRSKCGYDINQRGRSQLHRLLKSNDLLDVLDAVDDACEMYLEWDSPSGPCTNESFEKAFSKIPGVLRLRREEKRRPQLRRLLYIQGILRRRIGQPWAKLVDALDHYYSKGVDLDVMQEIATGVDTWEEFEDFVAYEEDKISAAKRQIGEA